MKTKDIINYCLHAIVLIALTVVAILLTSDFTLPEGFVGTFSIIKTLTCLIGIITTSTLLWADLRNGEPITNNADLSFTSLLVGLLVFVGLLFT